VRFEWDPIKAARNLQERGIDFVDAIEIFDDPDRLESLDERRDDGEPRIRAIGQVAGRIVLAVVYTDRNGVKRIISARRASRRERRIYHQSQTTS
jgi:uncharacterized DUF497 family protein